MSGRARTDAALARAFDGVAGTYGRPGVNLALDLLKHRARTRLLERLAPHSMICDAGCGTGADAAIFAQAGHRVVALDLSPAMCAEAGRRLAPWIRRGRAEVHRADFRRVTGLSRRLHRRCDAVWCHWASNFAPSLVGLAGLCRRVLRPGGIAAFTTANRWPLWEIMSGLAHGRVREAFRRVMPGGVRLLFHDRPVTAWAPPLGKALAPFRHGFTLERLEPLGLLLPPPSLWRPSFRRAAPLLGWLDAVEAHGRPFIRLADHVLVIVSRP